MSETTINGIPADLWDETQLMLQETLDEYVPHFLTQAVCRAILNERKRCEQAAWDHLMEVGTGGLVEAIRNGAGGRDER
jgi:hypothetical protein